MLRSLCFVLLVGCAGRKHPAATVAPVDDLEVRIDHVDLGAPCKAQPCTVGHAFLSLRNGTQPAKVRVVGVTIAGNGRSYTLGSTEPSIWASEDTYEPWNEQIGSEDAMWIRYALERVDWDHFAGEVRAISVVVEVDGRRRVFSVPVRGAEAIDDLATN